MSRGGKETFFRKFPSLPDTPPLLQRFLIMDNGLWIWPGKKSPPFPEKSGDFFVLHGEVRVKKRNVFFMVRNIFFWEGFLQ